MYINEYYPELLVDKVKGYIETVISFLEEQTTYDEIEKIYDNELQEEFDENDSKIETITRESIGGDVIYIKTV